MNQSKNIILLKVLLFISSGLFIIGLFAIIQNPLSLLIHLSEYKEEVMKVDSIEGSSTETTEAFYKGVGTIDNYSGSVFLGKDYELAKEKLGKDSILPVWFRLGKQNERPSVYILERENGTDINNIYNETLYQLLFLVLIFIIPFPILLIIYFRNKI